MSLTDLKNGFPAAKASLLVVAALVGLAGFFAVKAFAGPIITTIAAILVVLMGAIGTYFTYGLVKSKLSNKKNVAILQVLAIFLALSLISGFLLSISLSLAKLALILLVAGIIPALLWMFIRSFGLIENRSWKKEIKDTVAAILPTIVLWILFPYASAIATFIITSAPWILGIKAGLVLATVAIYPNFYAGLIAKASDFVKGLITSRV